MSVQRIRKLERQARRMPTAPRVGRQSWTDPWGDDVLIDRDQNDNLIGKTVGAIPKGATGTVAIYSGDPGFEVATGETIDTPYNAFADVADDKWVAIIFINGHPYMIATEC